MLMDLIPLGMYAVHMAIALHRYSENSLRIAEPPRLLRTICCMEPRA